MSLRFFSCTPRFRFINKTSLSVIEQEICSLLHFAYVPSVMQKHPLAVFANVFGLYKAVLSRLMTIVANRTDITDILNKDEKRKELCDGACDFL